MRSSLLLIFVLFIFHIHSQAQCPTTSFITGSASICTGSNGIAYSVIITAGSTYAWTITGGTQATGSNTNAITVNWGAAGAGNVKVVETSASSCVGTAVNLPITINGKPATSAISGPTINCVASEPGYSVSYTAGSTYLWTINDAGFQYNSSNNSSGVTPFWGSPGAGSVSVVETNAAGCVGTTVTLSVTILAPVVSSPVTHLCKGTSTTLSPTTGGTWVSSDVSTATVTNAGVVTALTTGSGQTVTFTFTDITTGCSANLFLYIDAPTAPVITGNTSWCANSSGALYSVTSPSLPNSYYWTITGGTLAGGNSVTSPISVQWGAAGTGTVSATLSNACATVTNFPVTINTPVTGSISGSLIVCNYANAVSYSVPSTSGSTYSWTITGGSQASGGSTNSITVNWGAAGTGTIRVVETNAAGCIGTAVSKSITINSPPVTSAITGNINVCPLSSGVGYGVTNTPGSTYVWTISGGTQVSGGTTNNITVNWGTVTGSVSVIETTSLGCVGVAANQVVAIVPNPTPTISTNPTVCYSTSPFVYTTETGMSNYVWTVTNGTITAGGTSSSSTATVSWGSATGCTIKVTYSNSLGCTGSFQETVYFLPYTTPSISSYYTNPNLTGPGATTVCQGYNAYFATDNFQPSSGVNFIWSVSPDGVITSGGTSQSSTVTVTWNTPGTKTIKINYTLPGYCASLNPPVITVNVLPLPTPTISGSSSVCAYSQGNQNLFTYTTEANMLNYNWTITGGYISSGNGTNSVVVGWSTAGNQSIGVVYNVPGNTCNLLTPFTKNVAVSTTNPTLTGSTTVCQGVGTVYTTQAGQMNYLWSVTGGTITAGGTSTDNTATVSWTTAGRQPISVTYTDPVSGCREQSATTQVQVNTLPTPAISGINGCLTSGNVYNANGGVSNYAWTVSPGGTITSGGTANDYSVTVTWTTTGAKSVSLNYTDANGCRATSPTTNNFTVNNLPVPTITGPGTVCTMYPANQNPPYLPYTGVIDYRTEDAANYYIWWVDGAPNLGEGSVGGAIFFGNGTHSVQVSYTDPNGCTPVIHTTKAVYVNLPGQQAITTQPLAIQTVCQNAPTSALTVAASGLGITYQWYISGGTAISGATGPSFTPPSSAVGTTYYYATAMDGCSTMTSGTATVNVINTSFTTQPSTLAQSVCLNGAATPLTVAANGIGAISYQWYSNSSNSNSGGTAIMGANSPNFTPPVSSMSPTWYYATATSSCGLATSNPSGAVTGVTTTITTQPSTSAQTVCQNAAVTSLTVMGSGIGTPSYLWYQNTGNSNSGGTLIPGATSASYTPSAAALSSLWYYATATTSCGTATSNASGSITSILTTITTQPSTVTQTVCLNGAVVPLTVLGNGIGTITYKWYSNTSNSNSGGTLISGATGASYTPSSAAIGSLWYYAIGTSSCGSATSATSGAISVVVTAITTQPSRGNQSVCLNAAVVPLTVAASGGGTITYQWYSNTSSSNSGGTLISGATGTSYTPSSSVAGSLYYYAVATSSCGGTNSSLSGVIIVYATPTPVISGVSSVCANQTGVSYSTTNVSGHTYAWTISNGTITAGSGTNHITVTWGASGSGALTVTEAVSGIGCAVTTASFPVTIGQSPSVHITGTSGGNLCLTGSATLTATSGISYRWSTGETTQSITVYDVGTYSCTVTFTGGCTGSASLNVIRSGSNCHAQERIKTLKNEPVPKDTITLSVYPVPADRTFTVTTSAPAASESPIFLYDLSGRIVATNHFQTGEQEKVISTEELSPGMYILRIIDSSHERFRKIIIQHD